MGLDFYCAECVKQLKDVHSSVLYTHFHYAHLKKDRKWHKKTPGRIIKT